jgi:uncharacterized protein YbjQ (UPF0145 family)
VRNSLACAEFDRRAALAAVDSRGVELGANRVVAIVFRSSKRMAVGAGGDAPATSLASSTSLVMGRDQAALTVRK